MARTKKHEDYLKRSTFNQNKSSSHYEYATLDELASILGMPNTNTYQSTIKRQVQYKNLPRF